MKVIVTETKLTKNITIIYSKNAATTSYACIQDRTNEIKQNLPTYFTYTALHLWAIYDACSV